MEIFAAVPFESSWELSVDGIEVRESVALEWATGFYPGKPGSVELRHHTSSSHKIVILLQVLLWTLVLVGFLRMSVGHQRPLL